jgi:hypothetical protein
MSDKRRGYHPEIGDRMKKMWMERKLNEQPIFKLCKKVSDPPNETKGEWKLVSCCVCGVSLRATVKGINAAAKLGVGLNPVCFDCAKRGPEYVFANLGSCGKVS